MWNKAGLSRVSTSEGVTVDLTAPIRGQISVNKIYMPCIGGCSLAAELSGFEDEESGISSCEFTVETVNNMTVMAAQYTKSPTQTETKLLTLQHDESYKVAAACYNTLGERSMDALSKPIRIDNTPPEKVRLHQGKT
jgi:prophage DNA circulation protein